MTSSLYSCVGMACNIDKCSLHVVQKMVKFTRIESLSSYQMYRSIHICLSGFIVSGRTNMISSYKAQ